MVGTGGREMSRRAGLEGEPPRKVRRIVPERIGKIIDVTGDDDPDAPTIIKIMPGMDPYAQLDLEEEELECRVGDETASEIHPDGADADDLSCITVDGLGRIDNDRVREIWAGVAGLKHQEGECCGRLAGVVDEMTPEVVYQSVQATPRPSANVPTCADGLLGSWGVQSYLGGSWLWGAWIGRVSGKTEESAWEKNTSPAPFARLPQGSAFPLQG